MLDEKKKIMKQYKTHAKQLIKEITAENNFKIIKRIKFGPRYFVAKGKYQGKNALFKLCLFPQSYDHLTNEKFSREILFLNFIQNSKYSDIKKAIPHIYASNINTRAWYIREFLDSQAQNINNGNIRFVNSFFTIKNLNWFKKTFTQLQKIKSKKLPRNFKKLLFPPQTLEYLWRFIGPFHKNLDNSLKHPGATKKIHQLFKEYSKVYKTATRILGHQEVYSSHILYSDNYIKLIDWENIGWSLPTHDIVTIWMRAHKHPAWQNKLKKYYFSQNKKTKKNKQLWDITVLMQSTFNVISYHYYHDKTDFTPLARYSAKIINKILAK
ncbi:MAG: hypothetical protein Q8P20_09220 [bacterium]|nr:hypothetical protein [bacterium]